MEKKTLRELQEKLEKQRDNIRAELERFAKEDKNLKGDWDTKYPQSNSGVGGQQLEEAADEVEEYTNLLPVEHNLELRLRDIELALEKIKNKKYGKCENCGKKIEEERLKIYPEARMCSKCQERK